jgi:hypothetical protein
VTVNTCALQSHAIQHRSMTRTVTEDDRVTRRNRIEIVSGWVAFLGEEEFIITVPTEPFVISKKREAPSKYRLEVRNGTRNT